MISMSEWKQPTVLVRTKSSRAFFICAAFLSLTALLLAMFPSLLGAIWHVFNGRTTTYREWRVQVPEEFFAFHRNGGLLIVRAENRFSRAGRQTPFDILLMLTAASNNHFVFQRDHEKFERIESAAAAEDNLVMRSTKIIGSGNNFRYCVEFGPSESKADVSRAPEFRLSCFVDGESTTLVYTGRAELSSAVYSIIQTMFKGGP